VVIPCYNRGRYLEEAARSATSQEGDFELVEIVIVDDHSDDAETSRALRRLRSQDAVRVLANPGRRGPAAARNVGLRAAVGDWIAFLDSDDVWLPGSLAAYAEIAASEPTCRWLGADMARLYEDGRQDLRGSRLSGSLSGPILRQAIADGRARLERPVEACIATNLTWTTTTMVKRDLLLELGGYEETLIKSEDGHLWIRLATKADLWFVPRVLALYRQHDENITGPADPLDPCTIQACRLLLADPDFHPYRRAIHARMARLYRRHGRHFRAQRQFLPAFQAYARSLTYAPLRGEGWRGLAACALRKK
jgi:glycosyltransferase involved in cell wall biosynthesis